MLVRVLRWQATAAAARYVLARTKKMKGVGNLESLVAGLGNFSRSHPNPLHSSAV